MVSNVAYGYITLSKTNDYDYNPIVIDGLDFTPTHGLVFSKTPHYSFGNSNYSGFFLGVLPDRGGYYWLADGYDGGSVYHLTPYFNITTSSGQITFTPNHTNSSYYRVMAGTYFYLTWREE